MREIYIGERYIKEGTPSLNSAFSQVRWIGTRDERQVLSQTAPRSRFLRETLHIRIQPTVNASAEFVTSPSESRDSFGSFTTSLAIYRNLM